MTSGGRVHGRKCCAEMEPEQSSRTARGCGVGTMRGTWEEEQTTFIYDCKQFVLRFFLRFCTHLILGIRPTNQTTQHDDSSRSRHVTLYHTYPQRSKPSIRSVNRPLIANPRKLGTLRTPTPPWHAILNNMQHK